MLSGRYPSDEFASLRHASSGTASRGRSADVPAPTTGGRQRRTIPDRGLFSVNCSTMEEVGELDEEMVYEMRPGEVFIRAHTAGASRHHAVAVW